MKKFSSVFELYAYAPMKKCLIIISLMFSLEVLCSYLKFTMDISFGGRVGLISELLSEQPESIVVWFAGLFFFFALAGNPVSKGKGGYTLERLSVSGKCRYWINVLVNIMYCVLFTLARAVAVIIQLHAEEKYAGIFVRSFGPQRAYLEIISDPHKLWVLPMNNTLVLILLPLSIIAVSLLAASLSSNAADESIKEKDDWGC